MMKNVEIYLGLLTWLRARTRENVIAQFAMSALAPRHGYARARERMSGFVRFFIGY